MRFVVRIDSYYSQYAVHSQDTNTQAQDHETTQD